MKTLSRFALSYRCFTLKRSTISLWNQFASLHDNPKPKRNESLTWSKIENIEKIKVEIKSKDMIKPFSPTSNHHRSLQLSYIDQIAPFTHPAFIFFYKSSLSHFSNSKATKLLKKSLSETLVQFYPLAGRIERNLSINCNDEGVAFYEANVLASLDEVTGKPNYHEESTRLLPFPPLNDFKSIVAAVQVNHFSCGGMAISVCISHKIADGATFGAFVNAWATKARGVSENDNAPIFAFHSASVFPQMSQNEINSDIGICREKIVTRRVIFDKKKLDALRKQCDDGQQVKPPTRVELISAFFWKMFIKVARAQATSPKLFTAYQTVNLRTTKSSSIPENWYGNLVWLAPAHAPITTETKYPDLVSKMRMAVKRIDTSYIGKIKTGECLTDLQEAFEHSKKREANVCCFSSLIRFPLYEINFGWGTPVWVSMVALPVKNMVFLLSTKCGEGVEVWVNMLEHDIAAFEQDHEFLSLASHNLQAKEQ